MISYDESLDAFPMNKKESVPGVFVQYTYADTSKITIVAGIRADYHNLYGTLITPRLHLRYVIIPKLTLRGIGRKGLQVSEYPG